MLEFFKGWWQHKKLVWYYGRFMGVSRLQLIRHDLDKTTSWRLFGYLLEALHKKGYFSFLKDEFIEFFVEKAVSSHKRVSKHHLDYWLSIKDGHVVLRDIPDRYLREMAVDWVAARLSTGELPTTVDEWPLAKRTLEIPIFFVKYCPVMRKYLEMVMSKHYDSVITFTENIGEE